MVVHGALHRIKRNGVKGASRSFSPSLTRFQLLSGVRCWSQAGGSFVCLKV